MSNPALRFNALILGYLQRHELVRDLRCIQPISIPTQLTAFHGAEIKTTLPM
jgi:hypothetical protein